MVNNEKSSFYHIINHTKFEKKDNASLEYFADFYFKQVGLCGVCGANVQQHVAMV